MSERTSSRARHQRYSGPELAPLLSRVVAELGSTAAIAEVNKIRSGGIGGFFCREEFEVLVANRPASDLGPADHGLAGADEDRIDGAAGGALDGSDARFRALLERRLEETSEAEADLAQQPLGRYLDDDLATIERPFVVQPPKPASYGVDHGSLFGEYSQDAAFEPATEPTLDLDAGQIEQAGARRLPFDAVTEEQATSWLAEPPAASSFWLRLRRTRRELDTSLPPDADVRAVVGPLALTTPVVRLLQCRHRLDPNDVVVLTSRAEIVSEPAWQLVRSSHRMVEAAEARAGRPSLIVIDVPVALPVWVGPLLERLRRADLGIVRYAVPGTPTRDHLDGFRDQASLPYVIDLVSKIQPDELSRMIDEGHPIATIAGIELTAELLMALREQVSLG